MARTLLATLPAAAMALRATRPTVSMHTNIFPTFTIKDKAAVLGQRFPGARRFPPADPEYVAAVKQAKLLPASARSQMERAAEEFRRTRSSRYR